ncbi:nucleotide sugar dehydrogenase [Bacillus sp. OV166]|uniref:nucleotide sugar dehydrogenase n=1 Tax=Bacillus sp. OV166 TaxID=1882763 RepID=UPI001C4F243B|nr:nucleotide sugar dehydrogenase [Bacillus sp. OV166]
MILEKKIQNQDAKVVVIGLGYVGLPLMLLTAESGYQVKGLDKSSEKVTNLKNGVSYIKGINNKRIKELADNGSITFTENYYEINEADVIIICVPTPLKENMEPDVSFISSSVKQILKFLKENTLIILESTVYPGATEELIKREIEKNRGFSVGCDYYLCYSPERVDPGNELFNIKNTPKVIGGATERCLEIGAMFYKEIVNMVVPVNSLETAEMVKLFENTFRAVNIGMVNEFAQMSSHIGINIWEVIEAADTKPFGFMPFYPGPGVGGHCIPVDPIYLLWKANKIGFNSQFIKLANEVNKDMIGFMLNEIITLLEKRNKGLINSKVMLLGVAYKKDVNDYRESPAIKLFSELERIGTNVIYFDPYIKEINNQGIVVNSVELTKEIVNECDLVVISTDHSNVDYEWITDNAQLIYDTRNVTKSTYNSEKIHVLGNNLNYSKVNKLIEV